MLVKRIAACTHQPFPRNSTRKFKSSPPSLRHWHYCQWGGQPSYYQFWCSRLIGQHLSDASRDLATLTFDHLKVTPLTTWKSQRLSLIRVFVLCLCTMFELRMPSRSEDIGHLFTVRALTGLVTVTFDLLTSKYVYWLPV